MGEVLCIDGPAGSGKSSVGKKVAEKLGFSFLDSGALYRGTGWMAFENGLSLDDGSALADMIAETDFEFRAVEGKNTLFLNSRDVEAEIRRPEAGDRASRVATLPEVREALMQAQRSMSERRDLVAEGRDMGTVVFPDAALKIFLWASPEVRAGRRTLELLERGEKVDEESVLREILERDERDANRAVAPMKSARSAVKIDTSSMTMNEVIRAVIDTWEKRHVR